MTNNKLQVLIEKLENHINVSDERHNTMSRDMRAFHDLMTNDIKTVNAKIDSKVSYKNFTWIIGILVTILITMFTYIANQVHEIRTGQTVTNENIALIKGKLDPYDVEFTK